MLYYTIYVKGLNNSTGYIDVALENDQLFKDFMQLLDVNVKPCRIYDMAVPPDSEGKPVKPNGKFMINLSEVTAMSTMVPDSRPGVLPPSDKPATH
ncbi:MAG: hypothetical protein IPK15_00895 [Verrucomicrobia bacterium]|jgi:hypothetical protein|nr:hypothetical protein [Verrucomicrobiota bacterium]